MAVPSDRPALAPSGDLVALAAELLVRNGSPNVGALMMEEHSADASGHCRGCPHSDTPAPVFPCRLRLIGEAAEGLSHARDEL